MKAGFTPLEALQAATIVPARVMEKARHSGTIEVGKRGDLIVLDANPLDDIAQHPKDLPRRHERPRVRSGAAVARA